MGRTARRRSYGPYMAEHDGADKQNRVSLAARRYHDDAQSRETSRHVVGGARQQAPSTYNGFRR